MSNRVKFAWFLLVASLVNIPLSIFWYANTEPPVILVLSWLAITITAYDIIMTSRVKDDTDE